MTKSRSGLQRWQDLMVFENRLRQSGIQDIAGVDEAGRGPLAGPVVAAACMIPDGVVIEGVDDSKKLSAAQRAELFERLKRHPEVCYGIGIIEAFLIDQINILRATLEAMVVAVRRLSKKPQYVLIDGPQTPFFDIPSEGIVKGDSRSVSIAAASIIAKQTRDEIMMSYHLIWPQYGFANHKGYATKEHLEAIDQFYACPIHRMSFEPLKSLRKNRGVIDG